jgi:GMP synthase (glutamine-hydrolysing)
MDSILILDFGSQTTALIGRRVRESGVYSEIIPGDSNLEEAGFLRDGRLRDGVRGIILSGSPESVYYADAPVPDQRVYTCGAPLLGICYGIQRITTDQGGKVEPLPKREYGPIKVTVAAQKTSLWAGIKPVPAGTFTAWMSHGDTITRLAEGWTVTAESESGYPAMLSHRNGKWFGVQFHPEVSHCERGQEILDTFVFDICHAEKSWTMEQYLEETRAGLRERCGTRNVLGLVSGGVDSTVMAALLLSSLDAGQMHLLYIDTGLMRRNETENVRALLSRLGAKHLHIVNAESEFRGALAGLEQPEDKRKAIGNLFITIQQREVDKLCLGTDYYLAQGTLYTDMIESGGGVGKKAHLIKSHHNVAAPLVRALREAGRVVEPLDKLYKDEVRAAGLLLGLEKDAVWRHPFPGPGLGVRILGEVNKEKCDILRAADAIYIEELHKRNLYHSIWQAFAVLLPVRSVGVAGDERHYGYVLALRAVTSADGMTAGVYPFNANDLLEISSEITNKVPQIGRVVYDVSSKPPATIEWE